MNRSRMLGLDQDTSGPEKSRLALCMRPAATPSCPEWAQHSEGKRQTSALRLHTAAQAKTGKEPESYLALQIKLCSLNGSCPISGLFMPFRLAAQKSDLKALLSKYFLCLTTKLLQCWERVVFGWNTVHLRCFIFLDVGNPRKAAHLPERLTVQIQFNQRLGNFSFHEEADITKCPISGRALIHQI